MQLAQFPLALPYLLNPVGIVGRMTISAEADSVSVFAVEFGILVFVLLLDVAVFRWANRVSDKLDENRMLGDREGLRAPDRRDRRTSGPRRGWPRSESSGLSRTSTWSTRPRPLPSRAAR
jgi:hypothetical protein